MGAHSNHKIEWREFGSLASTVALQNAASAAQSMPAQQQAANAPLK